MAAAEFKITWPTLFVAHDWVQQHCVVPDGFNAGAPFVLSDWQAWCLLSFYRLRKTAKVGQLAPAFEYRRSQIVLPQKAGKAPYSSAHICVEGVGPALFAGWAKGGEVWDCRDHGCGCGWIYPYEPGEAMGMQWPTPLIQITATSDDQTDNIYAALRPMIDNGPLAEVIRKTGEEFIRLPHGGRIDPVTSSARSRLGQRVTFCAWDEPGLYTPQTGMVRVAETQRRGLAGMGGRGEETTNSWDPAEESVAQRTAEAEMRDIFRYHPQAPAALSYTNKRERRRIHKHVYAGSPWVDLDAIEAEAAELLKTDPAQAERFFGNRIVIPGDSYFDIEVFKALTDDHDRPPAGAKIAVGFDGSRFHDSTGIVATCIESGWQWVAGIWERPQNLADSEEWEVPEPDVNAVMVDLFETYDVIRLYADPPYWETTIDAWAGRWPDRVAKWWTNRDKPMAYALRAYAGAITTGEVTHDGHPSLIRHIANARRRPTRIRDEHGANMSTIQKDRRGSPRKIDLAVTACLAWEARGDAIADGALNKKEPMFAWA